MSAEWGATEAALSVPHPLASAAQSDPEGVALEFEGTRWGAAALLSEVKALAGALSAAGACAGQRVAVLAEASPGFVVALHALGWLGASVAPLSVSAPREALVLSLRAVGAAWALGGSAALEEAAAEAGVAVLRPLEGAECPPERFWPLGEERLVLATSGSTGVPREVALTTAQIVMSAFGSALRLGHQRGDRWLCCLPLNHVGGLSVLLRCALYGTTAVLAPRFEAAQVARMLDAGEVTLASLVPQMMARVLDARAEGPLSGAVRAILLGGGPTPPELLARCAAIGAPVSLTWGMTEAASQICTRWPGDLEARLDCGPPLAFARVEPGGARGALIVRGPLVGGALETRDGGRVDAQGRVEIEGRVDDVILSGGENIAPSEIERVLEAHPAVLEAAVVGVRDEVWGERPVAALVPRGEARPDLEALRAWCRESLAPFMAPDQVRWTEALPRVALGKLSRAAVRAWWAQQTEGER